MEVDHLIIGQGVSGTLLSRALIKEGKKLLVVDDGNAASASKVASGIINPVTGKRLVRTWMIEDILPFASNTYKEIESELGVSLVNKCNILDFHATHDAAQAFNEKLEHEPEYLHKAKDEEKWAEYFRFNYGAGEIDYSLLINIRTLLTAWRTHLSQNNALRETKFCWQDCTMEEGRVRYKNYTAHNIIFCDGPACAENPYFERLPWSKDKGEVLIASIPGLPANNIYRQGINIVPWYDGLFWIGATHDWKFTDMLPTPAFRQKVEELLNYWLKLPYEILDHLVASRPVNVDRKPFVGLHPVQPLVGIFNGMGTKGCSVAPYFAHQFAKHLAHGSPVSPEVDVHRFARVLSR